MNKKIVLEVKEPLCDGELLIYKDGTVKSVTIYELLPQFVPMVNDVSDLKAKVDVLEKKVKELRGEEDE